MDDPQNQGQQMPGQDQGGMGGGMPPTPPAGDQQPSTPTPTGDQGGQGSGWTPPPPAPSQPTQPPTPEPTTPGGTAQ